MSTSCNEVWTVIRTVAGNPELIGVFSSRDAALAVVENDVRGWLKVSYEFEFHTVSGDPLEAKL